MTKIKARYIGESDPEFRNGEIYLICEIKNWKDSMQIAAENSHGEAYVMPRELFVAIE